MKYIYLFGTIVFTVYGQLILKWRIGHYGQMPEGIFDKITFLFRILLDPFILSGLISAFIASFFWMATMTKLDLSYAYPFMSLSFILVLLFSVLLFKEPLTLHKMTGMSLIVLGVIISSKSL